MAFAMTASAIPASAEPLAVEAESIRKLDIMLMVTSLRCRMGEHDFQSEYRRFSAAHLANLNKAGRTMRSQMHARYGRKGSKRALDRVSVQMANAYGNGHPWMNCRELKQVTHELSQTSDPARLSVAARELLADRPTRGAFMAPREAAVPAPAQPPILASTR
ncbi:MAG: S-adenosyl-L-homocysteine hydrolase [Pseudomonadota bacterium]